MASEASVTKTCCSNGGDETVKKMLLPLSKGLPGVTSGELPAHPGIDNSVPHAPNRLHSLSDSQKELAVRNAMRYFPSDVQKVLLKEFVEEFEQYGHIYMYRFRPTTYDMKAYPIECYPAKCTQAAAIMLMIMNNLDPKVAQFPHELVTYGGNGSVFQNWAQFHLTMYFLSQMDEDQTLSMYSGHPMGLFPSSQNAPRVVITNGMVVPNYSSQEQYNNMFATGVTMYGQMTAGSYCYIGPQGIVHGTTITVLNAGRKYLGLEDLAGKVYVSSGLGGMSGAQGKASEIAGLIGVIAEVSEEALMKRHSQGWIQEVARSPEECVKMILDARSAKRTTSIGFLGNVVSLWEYLASIVDGEEGLVVELGSDQTSLHNPYNGGYYPVQVSFDEANTMMREDPEHFKQLVQESLRRHVAAINKLASKGMRFWDYGNSFLLEASRASADVLSENKEAEGGGIAFRYPSYVQDIMGDVFSLGFGPFRWVCTSLDPNDLATTDEIAANEIREMLKDAPPRVGQQLGDNLKWIEQAGPNKLVVGSQARILYADALGRKRIALAFNAAVKSGKLRGPVVLSRDHHDVSGTDSPFRETSNITDGSHYTADMAVQNVIGDSFRGATWVSIHNGGGVGWGEVMNGGFGLVLDGSSEAARRASSMLDWDVNNGISRRCWGRNDNARFAIERAMKDNPKLNVTIPHDMDKELITAAFEAAKAK